MEQWAYYIYYYLVIGQISNLNQIGEYCSLYYSPFSLDFLFFSKFCKRASKLGRPKGYQYPIFLATCSTLKAYQNPTFCYPNPSLHTSNSETIDGSAGPIPPVGICISLWLRFRWACLSWWMSRMISRFFLSSSRTKCLEWDDMASIFPAKLETENSPISNFPPKLVLLVSGVLASWLA